jgi:hypothetical protein
VQPAACDLDARDLDARDLDACDLGQRHARARWRVEHHATARSFSKRKILTLRFGLLMNFGMAAMKAAIRRIAN